MTAANAQFPRRFRLRHRTDFERVYSHKAFFADQWLVVRGCANGLAYSRLGLSISRKVGGAVVRNRWKRLLREAFRRHRPDLPTGFDFVVRPRRGAEADCQAISGSLVRLLPKLVRQLSKEVP